MWSRPTRKIGWIGVQFRKMSSGKAGTSPVGLKNRNYNCRPPNIVVFGGDIGRKEHAIRLLTSCLEPDRYVFLPLDAGQVLLEPWQGNARLLFVDAATILPDAVLDTFRRFWTEQDGRLLCWGSPRQLMAGVGSAAVTENTGFLLDNRSGAVAAETGSGVLAYATQLVSPKATMDDEPEVELFRRLLRDHLHLDCTNSPVDNTPTCTACVLFAASEPERLAFRHSIRQQVRDGRLPGAVSGTALRLMPEQDQQQRTVEPGEVPFHLSWPVCADGPPSPSNFRSDVYFRWLHTEVLGRLVVHADVMSSTMDIIDRAGLRCHGLVCVAGRQTSGRGRGGHVWLSPIGGATFSVQLQFPLQSQLGQRLPFIQHLCSLAVAEGVRALPELQDFDIRLKWPNDLYYGDKIKLGGNIVRSTITGDSVLCTVGIGVNVANEHPTACVNSLLALSGELTHGTCNIEQVIASALSRLESLIEHVQRDGVDHALQRYYRLWLHQNAEVRLKRGEDGAARPGTVVGLDEYGFLRVQLHACGSVVSVQPDGNSFDMLHNLVTIRSG